MKHQPTDPHKNLHTKHFYWVKTSLFFKKRFSIPSNLMNIQKQSAAEKVPALCTQI